MHTHEASRLARQLMNENGLGHLAFEFDRAKGRLGACVVETLKVNGQTVRAIPKKIMLSEPLTRANSEATVRNTILHEIAHALAPEDGHGYQWRREAQRLGISPQRCASAKDVVTIPGKIKGMCLSCNEIKATFHRMPKRHYICPTHRTRLLLRKVG